MRKRTVKENKTGCFLAAKGMQVLGTGLLIALVLVCLPLTLPRMFGYHIYSVISGSMEPEIPVGSLLYIKETEPEGMEEGEVIAFYGMADAGAIITHRVVENRVVMGELITKGDANEKEDIRPVPYGNVIGTVVRTIPGAGSIAEMVTSARGKWLAAGSVGLAVGLQMMGGWLGRERGGSAR